MTSNTLILGGQKSGKSSHAESLAIQWQAANAKGKVVFIATATAHDVQMRQRIAKHRADRAVRLPSSATLEEPLKLATAIESAHLAQADDGVPRFVIVDCLTLWLTNWLMPAVVAVPDNTSGGTSDVVSGVVPNSAWQRAQRFQPARDRLLQVLQHSLCPVVLVSNEVGLGISPLGADVRDFVDELGMLNQAVARVCDTVVQCVAGLPLQIKSRSST